MLSTDLLRRDPDIIRRSLARRQQDVDIVDQLIAIDTKRRQALIELEELRSQRNDISKQIGEVLKTGGGIDVERRKDQVRDLGDRVHVLEGENRGFDEAFLHP